MPWFKKPDSLAYKIYQVYTETLDIFMKPKVSDFFDDGRKKSRAELLKKLTLLLQEVHKLENKPDEF